VITIPLKKTGGSAFPHKGNQYEVHGMTLRDYFAAKAMPPMIAAGRLHHGIERGPLTDVELDAEIATQAYAIADAMIAERDK
jgi:hypothetical protein